MRQTQTNAHALWWNKPVVYWHDNQVALTFHSDMDITPNFDEFIDSLNLDTLNSFLQNNGFMLKPFTLDDVPQPQDRKPDIAQQKIEPLERERSGGSTAPSASGMQGGNKQQSRSQSNLNKPLGKYIFSAPSGRGSIAICFFHTAGVPMSSPSSSMAAMGSIGGSNNGADTTRSIVNLLNQNLDDLREHAGIPLIAATPNWIGGCCQVDPFEQIGHGCPITPPIPVTGDTSCASLGGRYPLSLPQLSPKLQEMTGENTTVFVLDTIPTKEQIETAASNTGTSNQLLQDIQTMIGAGTITINHQYVPATIETSIQTGKDIYGRLFGFRMPDHGLFITGIIHDLAPRAKIECVRVLNDSGIGDFVTICQALENIHAQMAANKQELGQVVVNLSLVITPADEELFNLWYDDNCCLHAGDLAGIMNEVQLLRLGLHTIIKSLTSLGAVVVASAGNDSNADSRDLGMRMAMGMSTPARFGPRYPAAFPEVIAVGAVDKTGKATSYSNYPARPPQHNGIATYGGGIPTPIPPPSPAPPRPPGAVTWASVPDAMIGVYSDPKFSKLSADDPSPAEYEAPGDYYHWAHWSGTSFATPIISALAARVLQARSKGKLVGVSNLSLQDIITTAAGQQAILAPGKELDNTTAFGPGVSVLKAEQACQSVEEGLLSPALATVQSTHS